MFNGMKFHAFTLDNKMQVLAISDERFVKSSAALAVMAGSMQNPEEHLGLAHFLEHMLFLGTQDFPEVGEYESYLNKNGGGHNAYTSIDHTNYFFDVTHSAYEGALKRFSRFFVNPTLDEKYLEREINAVHSEHEKNLKDDGRREYRFLQLMTDPSHPFSLFATGDRNTLGQANRDVVWDFYQSHYSSNLMRLVMMSPLPVEQLEELANQHFADVSNKELNVPEYSDQLFVPDFKPKFHQIETVRDQDYLKLSFDVPDEMPFWKTKPTQFLAHLIGEEGEGSLLSYLKKKGWALGLETSTWWRMFHVKVHLTEAGKAAYEEIVKATFAYIEILKQEGLKEYVFEERKVLAEIDLNNMEPKSSMGRASHFSASMLYFPVESFLEDYYLFHEYSDKDFKHFLSFLRPDNLQVSLFTKDSLEGKKEPYYGIVYQSGELNKELFNELVNQKEISELSYPKPNPYLPTQLKMIADPVIAEPKEEVYHDVATIYSQLDTDLKIPKGSISLSFISNAIQGDPKNYLLAKLYSSLKREELNEWGYPVKLAGLNYNISHGYNTLTIDVSGYSQHLGTLLQNLISDTTHQRHLNHIRVSEETFNEIKKKMKKSLLNKEHDAAYQQLLYEVSQFFSTAAVHRERFIDFIDQVTLDEVNQWVEKFFNQVSIRAFVYGNIDSDSIKPAIDLFFDKTKASGLTNTDVEKFENKFLDLPQQKFFQCFTGANNNNGQITLYKLSDWNIKNQAFAEILSKLIEQPFFTELRTHQQLGYVVAAFSSSGYGFSGLGTLIQSQSHSAADCSQRAQSFLKTFLSELADKISHEDVETVKQSLLQELTQVPNSLGERLARFTTMAGQYHGDFQFFDKLAAEINNLQQDQVIGFVDGWLKGSNMEKGSITFLYNGSDVSESEIVEGAQAIENYQDILGSWKRIQPYKKSK